MIARKQANPSTVRTGARRFPAVLSSLAALSLLAAPWLGCGGGEEPAAPAAPTEQAATPPTPAPPAPAPPPAGGAGLPSPVADVPLEAIPLPADWPADMPHHPKAAITRSQPAGELGTAVTALVRDDVDAVASYYADQFAAQGWATDIRGEGKERTIIADKGDRHAAAHVRETAQGSEVHILHAAAN